MSFKAPRAPRLAASTPLRRKWAPTWEGLIKVPRALKRKGVVIRPQVDVTVAGVGYAQRRRRPVGASQVPRTPVKTASPQKGDKRMIEWNRWEELLPRLVPVYMELLQQSNNLRSVRRDNPPSCSCASGRTLQVTVYGLDGTYYSYGFYWGQLMMRIS